MLFVAIHYSHHDKTLPIQLCAFKYQYQSFGQLGHFSVIVGDFYYFLLIQNLEPKPLRTFLGPQSNNDLIVSSFLEISLFVER